MRGLILIGAAMLLGASSAAIAQQQPICADRPGKTTNTCTVPAGRFQLETAFADWTLQKGQGGRETLLTIGETTFKYGLTDSSDIELDVTPWMRSTSSGGGSRARTSGFGDLVAIYKHRLTPSDGALQVTAYPFVKIPTAKRALGNGKLEGGLLVPISYAIPNTPLSVGATPEIDRLADDDRHGHHWAMAQVATLGWQVTKKLSLSGEIWGGWDWDPDGTTRQASADGAVAYLVNNRLQLDAGVNIGLNRATPDVELYVGIARQF